MAHIIKTRFRNSGYFLNNQDARKQEDDIQTCAHCQTVIYMSKWREDGGWCRQEMKPLCGPCADKALTRGCEPFLKQLERYIETTVKREQFRKIAGI